MGAVLGECEGPLFAPAYVLARSSTDIWESVWGNCNERVPEKSGGAGLALAISLPSARIGLLKSGLPQTDVSLGGPEASSRRHGNAWWPGSWAGNILNCFLAFEAPQKLKHIFPNSSSLYGVIPLCRGGGGRGAGPYASHCRGQPAPPRGLGHSLRNSHAGTLAR